MQAYFEEGRNIGDIEELVRLGVEAGLSERESPRRGGAARRAGRHRRRRAARDGARHHRSARLHFRPAVLGVGRAGGRDLRARHRSGRGARRRPRIRLVTPAELTGRARSHIEDSTDPPCALHAQVITPFLRLRRAAAQAGFDLVPQSAFRDFDRQLTIWNAKFNGEATAQRCVGPPRRGAGAAACGAHRCDLACGRRCRARAAITGAPISISSIARPSRPDIACSSSRDEYAPLGPFGPLDRVARGECRPLRILPAVSRRAFGGSAGAVALQFRAARGACAAALACRGACAMHCAMRRSRARTPCSSVSRSCTARLSSRAHRLPPA